MSEYHFGVGHGKVSKAQAQQLNRIARKYDANFVAADMPEGPRYWFTTDNYGAPFDGATARAVLADAEAAGLWPV